MKCEILRKLKEHLLTTRPPNTAKKYYQAVKTLLDDLQFSKVEQISALELRRRLQKLKTSNDVSAAKNGLLALAELYPAFRSPLEQALQEGGFAKRNPPKRTFEPVKLDTIKRRINGIQDKRTKTAYRLMLISGARVSEVAALGKENIQIDESGITVHVENGKGGKDREITCMRDTYTEAQIIELLEKLQPGQRLFPSADALERTAKQRNFECHDLRRAFAKTYAQQCRQEMNMYKAYGEVMKQMGHARFRTTQSYLKRKIEI